MTRNSKKNLVFVGVVKDRLEVSKKMVKQMHVLMTVCCRYPFFFPFPDPNRPASVSLSSSSKKVKG